MITAELTFEIASHSADAIQRAAYRMSDRLSIDLATESDVFRCAVHVLSEDEAIVAETLQAFRAEVLDQVLRERIRAETAGVRNLILALAFSKTGLTELD